MTVTVVAIGLGHVAVAVADIDGILGPKGGSPGAILRAIALHLPRTTRSPLQEGGMGKEKEKMGQKLQVKVVGLMWEPGGIRFALAQVHTPRSICLFLFLLHTRAVDR